MSKEKNTTTYYRAPQHLGAAIKEVARLQGFTNKALAQRLGSTRSGVAQLYRTNGMSIKRLLMLSEVLNYNLLDLFWPNVAPPVNELVNETARLHAEIARLQALERENELLNARIDELRRIVSKPV